MGKAKAATLDEMRKEAAKLEVRCKLFQRLLDDLLPKGTRVSFRRRFDVMCPGSGIVDYGKLFIVRGAVEAHTIGDFNGFGDVSVRVDDPQKFGKGATTRNGLMLVNIKELEIEQ